MVNLFDLTKGNYRLLRTISYPDFPESKIVTDAQVKAVRNSEWDTKITVNGTYNGPTDVKNIIESGSATLELSSGKSVRQVWASTITPEQDFEKFPPGGELITISISPFQIDGNRMSYKWEGTVKAQSR